MLDPPEQDGASHDQFVFQAPEMTLDASATATLIAAAIAAFVAASLFVVGEVIKLVEGAKARRRDVLDAVLDSFAQISLDARNPRILAFTSKTSIKTSIGIMKLLPHLRRRDYILADWLWVKNSQVANAQSIGDAVGHSAGANGGIVLWLRSPRRARRMFVRQLDEWGIIERLSGLRVSKK